MEQNKEWVENFWSTGYVIRLGKDQYFQKIKDKRIVTAKIWKAAFFQSLKEAEMFAQRYLWYAGMNPQICYRGWILVSVESEEEQELFWNGKQFVPEVEKAKLFPVPGKCRFMQNVWDYRERLIRNYCRYGKNR